MLMHLDIFTSRFSLHVKKHCEGRKLINENTQKRLVLGNFILCIHSGSFNVGPCKICAMRLYKNLISILELIEWFS